MIKFSEREKDLIKFIFDYSAQNEEEIFDFARKIKKGELSAYEERELNEKFNWWDKFLDVLGVASEQDLILPSKGEVSVISRSYIREKFAAYSIERNIAFNELISYLEQDLKFEN